MRIGILAIQGDMDLHHRKLRMIGISPLLVKTEEELKRVDGLVLPGGESTTISKILERYGLRESLKKHIEEGMPVLATCAGIIILAKKFDKDEPEVKSLGLLDVKLQRNAYGRQRESFEGPVRLKINDVEKTITGIFIRAPKIIEVGKSVEELGWYESDPVLVRQGNILAMTFHPELIDEDNSIHEFFVKMVEEKGGRNV